MSIVKYYRNLPIRYRIGVTLFFIVILLVSAIFRFSFNQYEQSMITQSVKHLSDLRDDRIHDIKRQIDESFRDTDVLSMSGEIEHVLSSYDQRDFSPGPQAASYKKADRLIGHNIRAYITGSDFHDIFIISTQGDIIYTVKQESDLGTNLIAGKYKNTPLAQAFRLSQQLLQHQTSAIAYYPPSSDEALFLVSPVISHNTLLGAVAIQINWTELSHVLTSQTGLGHSGEVVAGVLKNGNPSLAPLKRGTSSSLDTTVPDQSSLAGPMKSALSGEMGSGFDVDYRNVNVVAAWGYIPMLQMGVVIKVDESELLQPVQDAENTATVIGLASMAIAMLIGFFLARSISTPIQQLTETVLAYANGKYHVRSDIDSSDETGQLAAAFNSMAENIHQHNQQIEAKNNELKAYGDQLEHRVQKRTATLAAANEEIKSFAYIVSHDLRSPLVNMKGFTGELGYAIKEVREKVSVIEDKLEITDIDDLKRLFEEEIPESMHFITTSVDKMDAMLTSILKLSRLGRRELQFEAIDLKKLCDEALMSLAHQIDETGTVVSFGELAVIENDRMVINQVMGNLIGNAIKYLSPDRQGKIRIYSEDNDEGITISVQDNGRGISDGEREKVFQIFRRGKHQDVVGEGMGLAYVQTLARAQNGNISYSSVENEGSTFTVFLPHKTINEV